MSFCNGTKGSKTDSDSSLKTLIRDRVSILKKLKPLLENSVFWMDVSSEEEQRQLADCDTFQGNGNNFGEANIIPSSFLV
jgi:hypothetical protein